MTLNAEADNGPKGGKLSSPASEMMSEKQDSENEPGHAGGDSLVVKTEGLAEKFL